MRNERADVPHGVGYVNDPVAVGAQYGEFVERGFFASFP